LTLTRPDAQVIDPAYAFAHPSEVSYEDWAGSPESAPSKGYYFENAMAGEWQLNIMATSAGDYWAYAMLTSGYTLEAETDKDSYAMGDIAIITATMKKSGVGLSGQTVVATLTNQDGTVDTVALTDQGDGTYTNTYLIPNIPGYLRISVDADGDDAGTLFTRHTSLQVTVQPEDAEFTGTYTETGDDTNTDGLYETLDFEVEINASKAGDYALSADLYAGTEFVAHTGDFFTLVSGTQTVMLPFNGTTIRNAGLDGPYTITNVLLIPTDLGLLTASGDDVLSTASYDHTDFGTCYELTLSHGGNGLDPTPAPANSTGCATGEHVEGETIDLTANPDSEWEVSSWSGTDNDASATLTNTVTMPASTHIATVNYSADIHPTVSFITRADANPTNAANVGFTVTFSEAVTGVGTSDFVLTTTGVSGASIVSLTGSCDIYTVTVDTGSGDGTIRLDLVDDDSIVDGASNPLDGGFTSGEEYTIVHSPVFADVSEDHWAYPYIETLYFNGVTAGCGGGNYCPDSYVTRAQMAIFLLRAEHGSSYIPPSGSGIMFTDVPSSFWAVDWIEQLAIEGITAGCGGGNYCPDSYVTRAQMAIFLLRAEHGASYLPPVATGVFDDVPVSFWAAAWIEQLAAEGVTAGCGGGNYCPDSYVTRAQMAVFLTRTFNLTLP